MPAGKLKEFLERNRVPYTSLIHSAAYTAQEVAALTHIKGKEIAKTVMVRIDDTLAMAVVPASTQVDLTLLKAVAGGQKVRVASEAEFRDRFPECETGAMPPFGNLYGVPVFVDETLTHEPEIAFNACTHRELIRLTYRDFAGLVQPQVASFSSAVPAAARL